jgi:tetratricopeptide (TPR) repeat protein/O-antigen ligase
MLAFIVVALLSTLHGLHSHPLLRTGLGFEAVRVWLFTLVNTFMAFYLPLLFTVPFSRVQGKLSIWSDLILATLWGICWFGFQSMKDRSPQILFHNMWDFYGGVLWISAVVYMVVRTKNSNAMEFFHVIFSVAFLAGIYGMLQYFGRDMVWGSLIQPYGGRPVSTFGNPNFLSSYLMLVAPVAVGFGLKAERSEMWGYFTVALAAVLGILCTLTRSTYVGLFAAFTAMAVLLFNKENTVWLKRIGLFIGVFIVLILLFPHTPLMKIQSPLARFTEIFAAMRSGESYGPWHQRLLIWSSAWDMVKERPFLGKGWGAFELFYPFYQGKYLLAPMFPVWRTHANNAHNILMEMWAQIGVLGVGASLWIFSALLIGGWNVFRMKNDGLGRFVCAGLLAGLVGMVADNFFGNVSIFFAVPAFLFWWCMGALFNEGNVAVATPTPVPPIIRNIALPALMAFCVFVGVYFFQRWQQEVYYFQGFKEARANMVVPSIKSLEKAYEAFPGEVNGNYELGNSYARHARELSEKGLTAESRKVAEKAVWAYDAALKANPGYDEIYFNLGITYAQMGNTAEAIRNLETAVFINPLIKDGYPALGNQYLNTGEFDKACRLFEQGVKAFPKDKDMWNNLGVAYMRHGDDEKALGAHRTSFKLDPTYQASWNNLNYVASRLKKKELLLDVPRLLQELQNQIAAKEYKGARRNAEELVKLLPDYPDAHLTLGNVLFYLQDINGGVRELNEAIRLKPDFTVAYVNLGHIYRFSSRIAEARQAYTTALSIDPSNQEAKAFLAGLPPS